MKTWGGLAGFLLCFGCYSAGTVRVLDSREVAGPRIPERAYADYLAGSLAEGRAELKAAKAYYERALSAFESAELRTSVGRVECQLGNLNGAEAHFQDAETLEPLYAPLFIERAQCRLQHRQPTQALNDALRAEALAPEDLRATQTTAAAFTALGKLQDAERHLRAYTSRHALAKDEQARTAACSPENLALVVRSADAERLNRTVTECRVSPMEIAELALQLGRAATALHFAKRGFELAQDSADARALLLLAAVRSGQPDVALTQLAASLQSATTPLSETGRSHLEELTLLLTPLLGCVAPSQNCNAARIAPGFSADERYPSTSD